MLITESDIRNTVLQCVRNILNEMEEAYHYAGNGDEFYTREKDIARELQNYDLSNKVVYCNCDNPRMSSFYKYLRNNFHNLSLKGLIATYYDDNPKMYYYDGSKETSRPIPSGRYQDNTDLISRCDIIVTNPPFSNSMASGLISLAHSMGKPLIIVGPSSIATNREMFNLIRNGQLNMGHTPINRFTRPDGTEANAPTAWWTTMPVDRQPFQTGVKYNPNNYQRYDNYDAIDIKDYREMPDDYYGNIGVSPRFLRVLDRNQFDILDKIVPQIDGKKGFWKYIVRRKRQD